MTSFKIWLEKQIVQAPNNGDMLKTATWGLFKTAINNAPIIGNAVGAAWDIGALAQQLWQMRQQKQDVTPVILKMMNQQDKGGAPANAFDLDDNIAAMLSEPSKLEIAKQIVAKIDQLLAQANAGKISPQTANIIAIDYIRAKIDPIDQKTQQQQQQPQPQQQQ
jgi:hypothetical protein